MVAVKTIIESSDLAEEVADAFVKEVTILKYFWLRDFFHNPSKGASAP